MKGNDDRSAVVAAQFDVAPLLARLGVAGPFKSPNGLPPGNNRERWSHAGIIDWSDDQRLDQRRKGLILEIELENLAKVGQRLLHRVALAGHLDLETAGDKPSWLMGDRRCQSLLLHSTALAGRVPA